MKDIFHYIDYRAYLRDYFENRKKENPKFSHQYFARKAGIKSSGFVLHVMKGERNLTKPVLLQISRAIGLDQSEAEYFEDLVSFDQTKNQSDKEHYFNRIAAKRALVKVKTLDDRQYEFYSAWYHAVIRELITLVKDADDVQSLAKLLIPQITPTQFKKSLKLQEELGLIQKTEKGKYVQTEPFLETGGPVRNLALVNYQKEMLKQAIQAWDRFKSNELMMNTVTLCMSEELMGTIKKEIRKFKKRLFDVLASDKKNPERVYHLTLNLFPVTKAVKE